MHNKSSSHQTDDEAKPVRVAIACQGGGAQTAFSAGALACLLGANSKAVGGGDRRYEIVALSGTSGGAVCASLAWMDLLLNRTDVGRDNLKVSRFWRTGYPDGNAALPYGQAWIKDWQEFWTEGRIPWLHTVDRLRMDTALAVYADNPFTEFSPFIYGVESNPYFFNRVYDAIDKMIPWPMKRMLDLTEEAYANIPDGPGVFWIKNFIGDMLDLLPFYDKSFAHPGERATIRREFDVQDAFVSLLGKYFKEKDDRHEKDDLGRLQDKFRHHDPNTPPLPELLIGAVDSQHTHDESWSEGRQLKKADPKPMKRVLSRIDDAIEIEQTDLEPHMMHRVERTNYKVFRGSRNLTRLADCVTSSAAIPTVMRGVDIDGAAHWDGLFSCNPPLYYLPDIHEDSESCPQEIWIVRVNPMEISDRPDTPREIIDRRNELAGNLSMLQEIHSIRAMNGAIKGDRFYRPVAFGFIDMIEEYAEKLDYPTKLDRRLEYVEELFGHGWKQADSFLKRWGSNETRPWEADTNALDSVRKLDLVSQTVDPDAIPG